jgi:hypothetical protein
LDCVYEGSLSQGYLPSSKPASDPTPLQNDDLGVWEMLESAATGPLSHSEILPSHENTELTVFGHTTRDTGTLNNPWSSFFVDPNGVFPCEELLNFDFSGSLVFDEDLQGEKELIFDSPYLKLRYLTALHSSVSRRSELVCLQTPFSLTSRSSISSPGYGFILQNLRSYPFIILDPTSCPTFIHKNDLLRDENDPLPGKGESLAICQSLVQLYKTKTSLTSAFIWRTIEAAQQRIKENVSIS